MTITQRYESPIGGYDLTVTRSYHPNHVTVTVPGTGLEWTLTVAEFTELVKLAIDVNQASGGAPQLAPADHDRLTAAEHAGMVATIEALRTACDDFTPADHDPGHCARCGQYDSDHVEMTTCEHCGQRVPFSETSEGMCSHCPDEPIASRT